MHDISKALQELRATHGLTLREVSERSGVTVQQLSDIEHGRTNPSIRTLTAIVNAFGVSMAEFFGYVESPLTVDEYRLLDAWRRGNTKALLQMMSARIADKAD